MTKKAILPILLAAALAISAAEPRVSRALLGVAEKSFDTRIVSLWNDALSLVGPTRGVYIEGIGVVLTAEVSLATPPTSLMNPKPTPQQLVDMHKTKLQRLPELSLAMKTALMDAAASFEPLPPSEQIVLAVVLPRFPNEDTSGLPLQVIMQGTKQQLLAAKRANGSGIDQAVKITQN